MREDLKDAYKTISDYDRHYSTVRATLGIFLFSVSYGIAAFLLKDAKAAFGNPVFVSIVSIIPALFLIAAFFLSCHFQRLTHACRLYMEGIEKAEDTSTTPQGILTIDVPPNDLTLTGSFSSTIHVGVPATRVIGSYGPKAAGSQQTDLIKVRINLERLIQAKSLYKQESNTADLDALLVALSITKANTKEADRGKLPQFVYWDAPNVVLGIAFILLTFIPCLALKNPSATSVWKTTGIIVSNVALFVIPLLPGIRRNFRPLARRYVPPIIKNLFPALTLLFALGYGLYCICDAFSTTPIKEIKCRGGFDVIGKIWPFDPGKSEDLSKKADVTQLLTDFDIKIRDHCGKPIAIFLIGSTDRRVLEGKRKSVYGGNTGLARARADYLGKVIKEQRPSSAEDVTFVPLISGPAWHGLENDPENEAQMNEAQMEKDRSVSVYGLWKTKSDPDSVRLDF